MSNAYTENVQHLRGVGHIKRINFKETKGKSYHVAAGTSTETVSDGSLDSSEFRAIKNNLPKVSNFRKIRLCYEFTIL